MHDPHLAPRDPAVFEALFRPKAVAVVGASTQPEKLGYQIFKNLVEAGFDGPLYPVNPKADAILGRKASPAVADLPETIDLAVIIVPARLVPETIRACGRKGARAAIVISGGFSETGPEGDRLQQETVAAAREAGLGLVGPNCQGVNAPYHGLCASWPLLTTRGRVAIISQSGTVAAALMDWTAQEGLGVSALVSMGNRADVDESDLVGYFGADPNTRAIALYLEGIKSVPRFLRAVAACAKPVVVLKAGRTAKGRKAAESHTRSLAGRDEIYEGAFRQYRIHRAATLEELYDAAKALAYLGRPAGRRIGIITSSGGSGILATDAAEMAGLDVAPLPEALRAALKPALPPHCTVANPLDLTGDATAAMYRQVVDAAAPHFDSLVVIFGDPIPGAAEVIPAASPHAVICLGGADVEREERARMHRKGIPTFPTPERGVLALSHLTRFEGGRMAPRDVTATAGEAARRLLGQARAERRHLLEPEAYRLLQAYDLPVPRHRFVRDAQEAVEAAQAIGFPVALKVVSPDILHKSEAGGVRLELREPAAVREAFEAVRAGARATRADARLPGALVMEMARPGTEIIVGMTRDPQFGATVMFGLGGIFVEVYRDAALRIAPIAERDAREMIREVKGLPLLTGFRGRPPGDLEAVAGILLRVSRMAEDLPEIAEVDLNPIVIYERGGLILDARVLLTREETAA